MMGTGAVVSLVAMIVNIAYLSSAGANQPTGSSSLAFGGIIGIALWLWMAKANYRGNNWARVTGTVFFGIDTLILVLGIAALTASNGNIAALALGMVNWAVGLAAVVLLWNPRTGQYMQHVQRQAR